MTDAAEWPETMFCLHPSVNTYGDLVTRPERKEYVRRDAVMELPEVRELVAALLDSRHAIRWCGGSSDFNEGGKAEIGWEKIVIPALEKIEVALSKLEGND